VEGMDLPTALTIAAHANRHPAHVKHAALQVLAARVAELEAQQGEPTGMEWGVCWPTGEKFMEPTEADARLMVRRIAGTSLVIRAAPGPWRAAT